MGPVYSSWTYIITLVDLTYTAFIVPISVAFDEVQGNTGFSWINIVDIIVFGNDLFRNSLCRQLLNYVSAPVLYLCSLILAMLIIVNILACIMIFIAELEGEENSWMGAAAFPFDVAQAGGPQQWVVAIYWATQTLTTVGYGDVVAVTVVEALVSAVFMLLAIMIFGLIVNIVGETVSVSSLSAYRGRQLRNKLQGVEAWGKERQLGRSIMEKVRKYYIDIWAPHADIDDAAHFTELPLHLRGEIVEKFAGTLFRSSHVFNRLPEKVLASLMVRARPRRIVAGHFLFEELDEASTFFVLQDGEMMTYQGVNYVQTLHGPAIIGQRAIFCHYIDMCSIRQNTEDPGTRELHESLYRLARSAAAQAEERKADAGTGPSSVDEQLSDGARDDEEEEAAPADATPAPANGGADSDLDLALAVATDELSMSHPGFTSEAAAQYLPRQSLFRWKLTEDVGPETV
ncbi:hypothetical protein QBZ16_002368 [Prototheca wickerhamii]|uniref:Cyclic nucleotide-binding domain-containing protein n=1 Tax=Prototheca wickerhamii TaxID=3111 RepID=A0AAD9IKG9_PROWI|nr:hypothetical protein QBZ16_002368 [Prototheca wickerhamii]